MIQGEFTPNRMKLTKQPSLQVISKLDNKFGADLDGKSSPKAGAKSTSKAQAEKELLSLNMQLTKVKSDIQKMENSRAKTGLALQQKKELETKLESLNRQILPLKSIIRGDRFRVGS